MWKYLWYYTLVGLNRTQFFHLNAVLSRLPNYTPFKNVLFFWNINIFRANLALDLYCACVWRIIFFCVWLWKICFDPMGSYTVCTQRCCHLPRNLEADPSCDVHCSFRCAHRSNLDPSSGAPVMRQMYDLSFEQHPSATAGVCAFTGLCQRWYLEEKWTLFYRHVWLHI